MVTALHQLRDLFPIELAMRPNRNPTMLANVRRLMESRIFKKHSLLRFRDFESDGGISVHSVPDAERFVPDAKYRMSVHHGFFDIRQGKTDLPQPLDHAFLTNRSMPRLASSVIRASALACTPASMAASKVIPSM